MLKTGRNGAGGYGMLREATGAHHTVKAWECLRQAETAREADSDLPPPTLPPSFLDSFPGTRPSIRPFSNPFRHLNTRLITFFLERLPLKSPRTHASSPNWTLPRACPPIRHCLLRCLVLHISPHVALVNLKSTFLSAPIRPHAYTGLARKFAPVLSIPWASQSIP